MAPAWQHVVNCPLPDETGKAGPAIIYAVRSAAFTDKLQAAQLWCFGTVCSRLINGFVSLIRLSDRTIYHLEDAYDGI